MKNYLLVFAASILMGQFAYGQSELIVNGNFTLPDDEVKYTDINNVDNWSSDDVTDDHNGREFLDGEPVCYMNNAAGSIYQIVGIVPSTETVLSISLSGTLVWDNSAGDQVTITVKASAFSGDDPVARVKIDSINFVVSDPQNEWSSFNGTITIPAGSAFAGQNLVMEFDVTEHTANPADDNIWVRIDNVSVMGTLGSSGINIHSTANFEVYPNPSSDLFHLNSSEQIEIITLTDLTGRVVNKEYPRATSFDLNAGQLNNGYYFIKVSFLNGSSVVKKVIKQ